MGKSDFEYLDEERKKLWLRVNSIETTLNNRIDDEIAKQPSDYSNEAKQASRKASEYKNKSEESKNIIFQYQSEIENKLNEFNQVFDTVQSLNKEIQNFSEDSNHNKNAIKSIYDEVESEKTEFEENVQKLDEIFDDFDVLSDKLSKLQDILTESDDTSAKIETLYKSLLVRKKEIDQLYYDIFGYKESENGSETQVAGLKDTLEKSYEDLKQSIKTTEEAIQSIGNQAELNYGDFQKKNQLESDGFISNWQTKLISLESKIEALLPNALTAGLSSAYSEKKEAEIKEYRNLNGTFTFAIAGLVCVSVIPFLVSIFSLTHDKPFERVLLDMPRLVLSILPLYIPVLWVAYSSNRKMNLSKRLSEEYSHKEVLSKTFEGLSTQIDNISDQKISSDLKNKLLYNILEVSSENPGKLISDYNKSDHPLMDALDKSVQLATAFEKLQKIPGFSSLAKKMNQKSKTILTVEDEKATKGIESIDENDA